MSRYFRQPLRGADQAHLFVSTSEVGARAERKVEKELLEDFKRVNGKTGMLFRLAEAALENPDGVIKEIVFPVVNETTLCDLVKDWGSTGSMSIAMVKAKLPSRSVTYWASSYCLGSTPSTSNAYTEKPVSTSARVITEIDASSLTCPR